MATIQSYTKQATRFINPNKELQRSQGKEQPSWVPTEIVNAFQIEFYSHLARYTSKACSLSCFKM